MPSMHASTGRLFRALAAFEPAPGVLYEVPLRPDEVIELLENDAPDGWLFVRVPRGLEGLVPESFLEELEVEGEEEGEEGEEEAAAQGGEGVASSSETPTEELTTLQESDRLRQEKLDRESKRVAAVNFQPGAPPLVPVKERAVAAKPAIFGRSGDRFA